MNIPDYLITLILAVVITTITLGLGLILLSLQKKAQSSVDPYTAFFEYLGSNKDLPNKISIYASPLKIGRHEGCQIIINDPRVSRHHALLEFDETQNRHLLRDSESDSGTSLNGRRLSKNEIVELNDHDTVAFGPIEYRFHKNLVDHVQSHVPTQPISTFESH